ncbi:MAG: alanine--tRNA ligase, partial [Planctomycetota bacterium]
NFSFGDYFKSEACQWAYQLITEGYGIDSKKLWFSVFHEDIEAREIWHKEVGIPDKRILSLGEKDNYWSMGDVGPCGPCSEIFFDRGARYACGGKCGIGKCDCDRYIEVWNLVFMQFEMCEDGSKVPLPHPSIDTGMGLERLAMVLQGVESVYETDLLRGLTGHVAELTGVSYQEGSGGTPHRIIADHVRSLSFAIADGAYPSNEERGYVLRRILRRAARYGYKLGQERPIIFKLVATLVAEMGAAYPELKAQQKLIEKLTLQEEEQFGRTLKMGMARFNEEVQGMAGREQRIFPAATAFFLHDSCGFPIDLTEQMAREQRLSVDRAGFEDLMEEQRERARGAAPGRGRGSGEQRDMSWASQLQPTRFTGYRQLIGEAEVVAVEGSSEDLQLILDATPFFAEAGGEMGDSGNIAGAGFAMRVTDTQRTPGGTVIHFGHLEHGKVRGIRAGMVVQAAVDSERRLAMQRNHTATHILHAALRQVLGNHVQQKGSLVAPDRLRFDLSHFQSITSEEIARIETLVQEQILADQELVIGEFDREEAFARGAMAFFGEKYGERVRVVEVPGFSIELCGGAHVQRTGEIGGFLIMSEGSVSAGIRRLEAVTGQGTLARSQESEELLRDLGTLLKTRREELLGRVETLISENRELRSGKVRAPSRDLVKEVQGGAGERRSVEGWEILSASWEDVEQDELLRVADVLKRQSGARVFILATSNEDGVRFVVGSSQEAPTGVVHCGEIAREGAQRLGGGGGGRPELAQAGGKHRERLPEVLAAMGDQVAKRVEMWAQA